MEISLKHVATQRLGNFYFNLRSIWLFTVSDIKTILLPSTAFAVLNGLALSISTERKQPFYDVFAATPRIIIWVWLNLLPFAIDNQRRPDSIQEDLLNKPWRTMPSRRMTPESAKNIMLICYAYAIIASLFLGNVAQCLSLIVLGYCYNELRGADRGPIIRNLINSLGFLCFLSGALQVVSGGSAIRILGWWSSVICGIVFTTVQTQDMYDQEGDAVRSRKTIPLVIGDGPARWSIAIPMIFWSWFAPWLWESSLLGYTAPSLLGFIISARTLIKRSVDSDKLTFKLWNLWMVSVYVLPLAKTLG